MSNYTIYCLCLHNKNLSLIKKLGYTPVGLGNDNFSNDWLRDNTLDNISHKNKYYAEYTFHYWFWKNILPKINDNHWIVFCAYRDFWSTKKNIKNNNNFIYDKEEIPTINRMSKVKWENLILKNIPNDWNQFDTVIGDHMLINNLKFSKLIKRGLLSLIRNPLAIFKSKRSIRFHFDMWHGNGNLDRAIDLLDDENRDDFRKYTRKNISFSRGMMFACRSKKIMDRYYNSVFSWLSRCENIFGFDLEGYGKARMYGFLVERYMSYWFDKYANPLLWPVIFYDINK